MWTGRHKDALKEQGPWAIDVKREIVSSRPRRGDHGQSLRVLQQGISTSWQHCTSTGHLQPASSRSMVHTATALVTSLPSSLGPVSLLHSMVKGSYIAGETEDTSPVAIMWKDHSGLPKWTGLLQRSPSSFRSLHCMTFKLALALGQH